MLVEAAEDAAAAAVSDANQKADAAVAAAEEERARSAAAQLELKQVCGWVHHNDDRYSIYCLVEDTS